MVEGMLSVSGSVIELLAGTDVLANSTDRQENQLALSSGGVQLIRRSVKNPLPLQEKGCCQPLAPQRQFPVQQYPRRVRRQHP